MHRTHIFALCAIAGGTGVLFITPAESQLSITKSEVALQSATPGFSQSGNANISGTMRAGQFIGSGSGLAGVNADLLDGLNSTAFLQAVPNPLTLSGNVNSGTVIRGENLTSSNGYGVIGTIQGTSGSGVHGRSDATTGLNQGVSGSNTSSSGRGVYGYASSGTGTTFGGYFESFSSAGRGVLGYASNSSGQTYGVYGAVNSISGIAVFGDTSAPSGATFGGYFVSRSTGGQAVHGAATATSGTTYGVVGEVASPSGYGVYFLGRLAGSGTKSFRIDHPLDPLNKYLVHYCAEGPEPLNAYTGNVTTDAKGHAWVELPDYFDAVNREPRYTLTVVDDNGSNEFVQVKVGRKIRGNRFLIMSSAPRVEVSWRVDAVRNDRFVQTHGAPVELDKPEHERGSYQHPELYGLPPKSLDLSSSASIGATAKPKK